MEKKSEQKFKRGDVVHIDADLGDRDLVLAAGLSRSPDHVIVEDLRRQVAHLQAGVLTLEKTCEAAHDY